MPKLNDKTDPLFVSRDLPCVEIWTDGGCAPNPGVGGFAAILIFGDTIREVSGAVDETTNNRMEMQAVIAALELLKRPCKIELHSDSMIVHGLLNGTGMKPHKRANQDLVQKIVTLKQPHEVTAHWVKGHSGVKFNERCDQLCEQAIFGRAGTYPAGGCGIPAGR